MKLDEEFYEIVECRAEELMPICARFRSEKRLIQRMSIKGTSRYTLFVRREPEIELPVTVNIEIPEQKTMNTNDGKVSAAHEAWLRSVGMWQEVQP